MTMNEIDILPPSEQPMQLSAIESQERALIDIQISTAKRYPRTLSRVKADMLSFATLDEETAASCFYTVPRGGKNIQGPSVRLAEIAVSCYGNLRAGSRVVEAVTGGDNPHVVTQSVCHDLEKNVAFTIEKRRRIVKKRSKETIDEDDINLACNAGAAISFRDAVFKVVPMALIKPVYEAAMKVAIGDAKTLADRRARGFEAFAKMGIVADRVLAMLSKAKIEDVDVSDLEILIGVHTAIKDGQTSIDEAFPAVKKTVEFEAPKKAETTEQPKTTPSPKHEPVKKPAPADEASADIYREAQSAMDSDGVTLPQVVSFLKSIGKVRAQGKFERLNELPEGPLGEVLADWKTLLESVKGGAE